MSEPPIDESTLSLDDLVTSGVVRAPARIGLYGIGGVGKSTWVTHAPRPVILSTEKGTDQIGNATRIEIKTWAEFRARIVSVLMRQHTYKTLVIDTVTALEAFLFDHLRMEYATKRDREDRPIALSSVEEILGGYGKWVGVTVERWSGVMKALDNIRERRGMNIILVMHPKNGVFRNPEGQDFTRFAPQMNDKAADRIVGWLDALLFAGYRVNVLGGVGPDAPGGKRETAGKMAGGELEHILTTVRGDGKEAKNRYKFPAEMLMPENNADAFWRHMADYLPPESL